MPDIRDKSTVKAIAREFTSNGRNKEQALKTIGYAKNTAEHRANKVLESVVVKQAIEAIDDKNKAVQEHNRQIAIDLLTSDLSLLNVKANKGNIPAIRARTAIIRELDAISNLHSQTVTTIDKTTEVEETERKDLEQIANTYKLKIAQ